jgi:hypothetical protein
MPIEPDDLRTWPIEWLQVVPMPEAERLSSLSEDSLERTYGHLIMRLSPRRRGMRRGHALMLGTRPKDASAKENSAV